MLQAGILLVLDCHKQSDVYRGRMPHAKHTDTYDRPIGGSMEKLPEIITSVVTTPPSFC